jgi:small subunit ribosomal protein S17
MSAKKPAKAKAKKEVKKAKPAKMKEKTSHIKAEKKIEKSDKPKDRKEIKAKGKTIGLSIGAPEKTCEDYRCPWHGRTPVRGRAFKVVVKSSKLHSTAVVEWGYHKYSQKYERYERRKSRVVAHNPPCIRARDGDEVMIAECRPLSKTKKFIVVGILKKA